MILTNKTTLDLKNEKYALPLNEDGRDTDENFIHPVIKELTTIRRLKKITQSEVAEKLNTKASAIARLEAGGGKRKHSPSLRTLQKYAQVLNCKIELSILRG